MKTKEMIEQNNRLREQLTAENKVYYEDLLLYIRFESFARDEKRIESFLLEILQDILSAQTDGLSAREYFGKNPKAIADEFLKSEPKHLWELIKIATIVLVSYAGSTMYPALTTNGKSIDMGAMLISSVYALIMVCILFKYLGWTIYTMSSWRLNKKLRDVLLIVVIMLLMAPPFLIDYLVKTPFKVSLDGIVGIVVIMLGWLIGAVLYIRETDKKIWTPFVFAALAFGSLGIANRIPRLSAILDVRLSSGKCIYAGILILISVIFYTMTYFSTRKMDKDDK